MPEKTPLSKSAQAAWYRADIDSRLSRKDILQSNEVDALAAQRLVTALTSQVPSTVNSLGLQGPGITSYSNLSIGESLRKFDSDTTASLTGWIDHSFSFEGWALGLNTGRIGLGLGSLGLRGQSTVDLSMSGRTRTDLMGDGLVAVFDTDSFDTIRMVCPSENSTAEFISEYVKSLLITLGEHTWMGEVLQEYLDLIVVSYTNNVSYVSDRLAAALRAPADRRPTFRVTGIEVSRNAVLGCAIQIGEGEWNSLFPGGLMSLLSGTHDGALPSGLLPLVDRCNLSVKWVKQKQAVFGKTTVTVDGEDVGRLRPGEQVEVQVTHGPHSLCVRPPGLLAKAATLEFDVSHQDELRFLCGVGTGLIPGWRLRQVGIPGDLLRD